MWLGLHADPSSLGVPQLNKNPVDNVTKAIPVDMCSVSQSVRKVLFPDEILNQHKTSPATPFVLPSATGLLTMTIIDYVGQQQDLF
ncbi:hypothetical protein ACOSQ2_013292 [Xanthoceras sorbifolium]